MKYIYLSETTYSLIRYEEDTEISQEGYYLHNSAGPHDPHFTLVHVSKHT